jgi:diguanylate cyclase (GGDEF)-like protein
MSRGSARAEVSNNGKLMNGAAFFLAVNFVTAASFGAVFLVVATRSQSRTAARLLGAGYGVASLSAICELLVAYTDLQKPWALGAFTTVLIGLVLLAVGIGKLYERELEKRIVAVFICASVTLCYSVYNLPRGTPLQAFSYQSPFAVVLLTSATIVFLSRRRQSVDRFLAIMLLLTGLHFFAKAAMAVIVGSGTTAKDYVHTNYALISQSATGVLVVAVGLTLLAVLTLDIMAEQRSESEQDMLSTLANRRGFDRHVHFLLAQAPNRTHAIVLCDLDKFKRINDTYGHHVGDLVIKSFGKLLRHASPERAPVGRIGGEEFAIFLPDSDIDSAVLFAQALRAATMTLPDLPSNLIVTASFGVSLVTSSEGLAEALRQADIVLYKAKNAGRNRVKIAVSD